MSKIRGDPRLIALAHPTRHALYAALCQVSEAATVALEKQVNVTRYHLYHHLQQLVKAGLVENHRDVGRARWWRVLDRVDLAESSAPSTAPISAPRPNWVKEMPSELVDMLDRGARLRFVPLGSSAAETVGSKRMLEQLARENGIDLNIPFTFVPGGVILVSQPR